MLMHTSMIDEMESRPQSMVFGKIFYKCYTLDFYNVEAYVKDTLELIIDRAFFSNLHNTVANIVCYMGDRRHRAIEESSIS